MRELLTIPILNYRTLQKGIVYKFLWHNWLCLVLIFCAIHLTVILKCIWLKQGHLLLAGYASHCDIINQEVFAPCHAYISPGLYYQLCRFDACKCGSSCLCNALAHYAYVCSKHGVIVDFRSHISYCGE